MTGRVKHPAARVSAEPTGKAGSRGATCSARVALATQVESLRNPAKPRTPFLPVAASCAIVALATKAESHRASWQRRVKKSGNYDFAQSTLGNMMRSARVAPVFYIAPDGFFNPDDFPRPAEGQDK